MDAFCWNPCFVTGLVEVDAQHRHLVDVINRFGELVMAETGATRPALDAVFVELADYARYHFADEEALMESAGLDPAYVEHHRQSHARFLEEVGWLREGCGEDGAAAKPLLQFLTHWLAYHILGADQVMSRQIDAVRAGASPAYAVQNHGGSQDPATDALLDALNGLFEQVSERNRELVLLNRTLEARVAERTRELT